MHTMDWMKNPRADRCQSCGTEVPESQVILYDLDSERPFCKSCSNREFTESADMVGITIAEAMTYCSNPEEVEVPVLAKSVELAVLAERERAAKIVDGWADKIRSSSDYRFNLPPEIAQAIRAAGDLI